MGQPIVVVEKPSIANPGMVRFETNRSITGMGHEVYPAGTEVRGDRPPDELARRLLAHGGVAGIHMNGSVVTVDLEKGHGTDGLREIIESLYIHYPPTLDDPDAAVADADAPETEGELVEQEAAAPADEAPAPEHPEPVPAAEAAAEELDAAAAETAEPPAAPAADAEAEPDEVTDADVQQVEGDAPTTDQAPVGGTPSDPPADAEDPATAPTDEDTAPS
jgi:hypothetical protein